MLYYQNLLQGKINGNNHVAPRRHDGVQRHYSVDCLECVYDPPKTWYGHLKFKDVSLWKIVLASWGIAFFEYCFMVPANRFGNGQFNVTQLKTIQEAITLIVFTVFSIVYLKEEFKWNYVVGFILIIGAVFFIFKKWQQNIDSLVKFGYIGNHRN